MTYISFELIQYFILVSVLVYFIFDYVDSKRVKGEREEFLKLKTFEFVQKVTLFTVTVLSVSYLLYPGMPAFVPIILIVICSMYSEIFGKIYFRQKY